MLVYSFFKSVKNAAEPINIIDIINSTVDTNNNILIYIGDSRIHAYKISFSLSSNFRGRSSDAFLRF